MSDDQILAYHQTCRDAADCIAESRNDLAKAIATAEERADERTPLAAEWARRAEALRQIDTLLMTSIGTLRAGP